MKKSNKKLNKENPGFTISREFKSHADDPFFVEKTRKAKEFIEKHGFPKELVKKRNKKSQFPPSA